MALILHLETSTDVCSVALAEEGVLRGSMTAEQGYRHAARLGPLIEELLAAQGCTLSELSAIAISSGPGSYTALRVGTATAKGLCYGLEVPLIACSSLASLALASRAADTVKRAGTHYVALIDARRMEVYRQIFDASGVAQEAASAYIMDENAFADWFSKDIPLVFSGDGAAKLQPLLNNQPGAVFSSITNMDASYLVPLAWRAWQEQDFADTAYFEPFYLKSPNITKAKPRL